MPAFTFDGKTIPFEAGDTLGSALHRAGVRAIGRSMKYHRPRGLYCCTGSCASCYVDLDGIPNTPACTTPATDGARVASQNRLGSARHDLLGVVDKAFPGGFEPHTAFTLPVVNRFFLKAVRSLSGWGHVPDEDAHAPPRKRHVLRVDEVIVGAGRHGLLRAQAAAGRSKRVLLVDEQDRLGGSASWDPSETDTLALAAAAPGWAGVEAWTGSLVFGYYRGDSGGTLGIVRDDDLWEVSADRFTLAPGRHDGVPVFPGNDLPGILSLRGARRLLHGHGVLPGKRIVVHGTLPADFRTALMDAGAEVLAEGEVKEAKGGAQVEKARVDGTWQRCDAVVCVVPGTVRVELFQQAGCQLTFRDGLVPVLDGDATTVSGIHGAFTEGV